MSASASVLVSLADQIRTAYARCLGAYPDDVNEDGLLRFLQQEVAETLDSTQAPAACAARAVQTLETVIADVRHIQTAVAHWGGVADGARKTVTLPVDDWLLLGNHLRKTRAEYAKKAQRAAHSDIVRARQWETFGAEVDRLLALINPPHPRPGAVHE